MISKNRIKSIRRLASKKFRISDEAFVAEGFKIVGDLLDASFSPLYIAATSSWISSHRDVFGLCPETDEVTEEELGRLSFLDAPQSVLAVFRIPSYSLSLERQIRGHLTLMLDDVQNPGNLGTIVRLADWFGIEDIVCSPGCADLFNPKTVQATMGALAHVRVHYQNLTQYLEDVRESLGFGFPVYGTFLDGDNIYSKHLAEEGIIVMGNEGRGISAEVENFVSERLYVPSYPKERPTTESLNVAIATAVVCAEFRRRQS